eukprot:3094707-Amphidinium_carterae.1
MEVQEANMDLSDKDMGPVWQKVHLKFAAQEEMQWSCLKSLEEIQSRTNFTVLTEMSTVPT